MDVCKKTGKCGNFEEQKTGGGGHPFPLLLTIIPPTWKKWTFSWFFFVSDVPYQSLQYPMWRFFIAMHCKTNTFSLNRPKNKSSKNMIYSNEHQITAWQLTTLQAGLFFQISNQSSLPSTWRFPIGSRTILDSIGSHVDQLDWRRNNPISCGGFSLDDESARHIAS